jgi:hypothetical protein
MLGEIPVVSKSMMAIWVIRGQWYACPR